MAYKHAANIEEARFLLEKIRESVDAIGLSEKRRKTRLEQVAALWDRLASPSKKGGSRRHLIDAVDELFDVHFDSAVFNTERKRAFDQLNEFRRKVKGCSSTIRIGQNTKVALEKIKMEKKFSDYNAVIQHLLRNRP